MIKPFYQLALSAVITAACGLYAPGSQAGPSLGPVNPTAGTVLDRMPVASSLFSVRKIHGDGRDLSVDAVEPRFIRIPAPPAPSSLTITVTYTVMAPDRNVAVGGANHVSCDGNVPGTHSCKLEWDATQVGNLKNGDRLRFNLISMDKGAMLPGPGNTNYLIEVPVIRVELEKPFSRALTQTSKGGPVIQGRPDLHPAASGDGEPKLPMNPGDPAPLTRLGDKHALNPQPIPPGRGETAPRNNPGDPAPTIQNDNAIIFQRGLKNSSTTNAGVQRSQSFPMANKAMPASMMEMGVNRYGGDYASRDLGTAEQCQAACKGEAQCKSWSWVRPGVQGPQAKCWLKNSVPAASRHDCCVSGVK